LNSRPTKMENMTVVALKHPYAQQYLKQFFTYPMRNGLYRLEGKAGKCSNAKSLIFQKQVAKKIRK